MIYIAFVYFRTFENRVILLPINVLKLFLPCNKFEMILEQKNKKRNLGHDNQENQAD